MTSIAIDLEKNGVKKVYFDPEKFEGTGEIDKPFNLKEVIINQLAASVYEAARSFHDMDQPMSPMEEVVNLLGRGGGSPDGTILMLDISAVSYVIPPNDSRIIPPRGAVKLIVPSSMMIAITETTTNNLSLPDNAFEVLLFNHDADMEEYLMQSIPYLDMPETYIGDFYFDYTQGDIEAYLFDEENSTYTTYAVFRNDVGVKKVYAFSISSQGGAIATQDVTASIDWSLLKPGQFGELILDTFYIGRRPSVRLLKVHRKTGIGAGRLAYGEMGPVSHASEARLIVGKNGSWAGDGFPERFIYEFVIRNATQNPLPLNSIQIAIIPLGNPSFKLPPGQQPIPI